MVGNNSNLEIFNRIKETNSNNADEYSNSKTYVKDEYCIYNNTLYKANQAIDTAEEFTESHWTETTVGTELKSQADSISALNSSYGENENGSYLRLPDGTQICWLSTTVTDQSIDLEYGGGLYQGIRNWTFPIPFVDTPAVSCGAFRWGASGSWGSVSGASATTAVLRGLDIASHSAGTICIIQVMAIGRWKS